MTNRKDGGADNDPIQMAIDALEYYVQNHERNVDGTENQCASDQFAPRAGKALTALRQHQQDGGWLPIETAPKDGTRILITDGKYVYQAHYTDNCEFGQFENDHREGWQIWACEDGFYSSAMEINEAVKWQPLPPAPKKENDDG